MRFRALWIAAAILGGCALIYAVGSVSSKARDAHLSGPLLGWAIFYPRSEVMAQPLIGRFSTAHVVWDREPWDVSGYFKGNEISLKMIKYGEWRDEKGVPLWAEDFGFNPESIRGQWLRLPLAYGDGPRKLSHLYYGFQPNGFPFASELKFFPEFKDLPDGKVFTAQAWRSLEVRRKAVNLPVPKLPETLEQPF